MLDRLLPLAGVVIFTAATLATLVPSADGEGDATGYDVESTSSFTSLSTNQTTRDGTVWDSANGHTLARKGDGHFYAKARIEGRDINMMVDTGASVIALTGRDAQSIGLSWTQSEVQPVARGASGTVFGVRTRLRDVEIGGMRRHNVQAIIVPRGLDVSLLGQSYLSQIGTVEISSNQMILSDC